MAASYPTSVRTFTNKVDIVDTIFADHVNVIQDELRATQSSLGLNLLASTYTGTFAQTTTWTSVANRLANIEAGLVSGVVGSPYFKKSGDNISPASGSVGLTLKTTAGSTNLLEARNAANTLRFNVDYDGLPKVGTAAMVYVGSSEYNTITSTLTTTTAVANANPFNAFLLAGM